MPKMTILNEHEIKRYDYPPAFQNKDRKQFLTLPEVLVRRAGSFHSITNKVCFHLLFGYFKACGRFFSPARFRMKDIEFVCARLGSFAFAVEVSDYKRATVSRHKELILEYFKCTAFEASVHSEFIRNAAGQMIRSQFRPKLIFNFMVDLLRQKHVELPAYHTLLTIITSAVSDYDRILFDRLKARLTDVHKDALDQLLERTSVDESGNFTHRLTGLKHFNPGTSNKHVHANLESFKTLQTVFKAVEPLIGGLKLNGDAIRYYGELVKHYQIQQITRRSPMHRYLYLLAFTAYQVFSFEDWLTDTLLLGCRKTMNFVQHDRQERLLKSKTEFKPGIGKVLDDYFDIFKRQQKAVEILWSADFELTEEQKIEKLRLLFPKGFPSKDKLDTIDQLQKAAVNAVEPSDDFEILEAHSLALQKQVAGIVKSLDFNPDTSDKQIIETIEHFSLKDGVINKSVPADFLDEKEKQAVFSQGKFRISLFKILFFKAIDRAVRDGSLNLKYSYRYKAFDEYLIEESNWKTNKIHLLKAADLSSFESWENRQIDWTQKLEEAYRNTNQGILLGENKFLRFRENGKFIITTPKSEQSEAGGLTDLFPKAKIIPLSEVLATVQHLTGYLGNFVHFQPKYQKKRPDTALFYAGITALG